MRKIALVQASKSSFAREKEFSIEGRFSDHRFLLILVIIIIDNRLSLSRPCCRRASMSFILRSRLLSITESRCKLEVSPACRCICSRCNRSAYFALQGVP